MKYVSTERKLSDLITSNKKLIDDLKNEVELMSTKGITKNVISGYSILNDSA